MPFHSQNWCWRKEAFLKRVIASCICFLSNLLQDSQSSVGSPSSRVAPQIIGAEDDDFDTEHEQVWDQHFLSETHLWCWGQLQLIPFFIASQMFNGTFLARSSYLNNVIL